LNAVGSAGAIGAGMAALAKPTGDEYKDIIAAITPFKKGRRV
jgi:hypothetical protein